MFLTAISENKRSIYPYHIIIMCEYTNGGTNASVIDTKSVESIYLRPGVGGKSLFRKIGSRLETLRIKGRKTNIGSRVVNVSV